MSVRIGMSQAALMPRSTRRPSVSPGPRNERFDVRFALSYDALKMNGTRSRLVMSVSRLASSGRVRLALDHARAGHQHERERRRQW